MAGSLFSQLFGCCMRGDQPNPVEDDADENSRLIIPTDVDDSQQDLPDVVGFDQQKIKDRLSTIVRATEGKMVNVAAHVPFNLHNKTLSQIDPSGSRSASAVRNYGATSRAGDRRTSAGSGPPTPSTASFYPGGTTRQHRDSSSSDSMHGMDQSIESFARAESVQDLNLYNRNPILNVRLVTPRGVQPEAQRPMSTSPRGRSSTSPKRCLGGVQDLSPKLTKDPFRDPSDGGGVSSGELEYPEPPIERVDSFGSGPTTPSAGGFRGLSAVNVEGGSVSPATPSPITPTPPTPSKPKAKANRFKIQDAGALSLSWGA